MRHAIRVLSREGDSEKASWDPTSEVEVERATSVFNQFLGTYLAFAGPAGTPITTFDKEQDILFAPTFIPG